MAKHKERLDEEVKSAYRRIKKGLEKKEKGKCLDEETLISYVERRLNKTDVEAVEKHLSLCSKCSEYVVVMNRVNQMGAREKLPQVSDEMIKKAKNLVKKTREGIGMKKPIKSASSIAEWLAKMLPPLKPIPIAVGTIAAVFLVFLIIFTMHKEGPGPGEEKASSVFELTASLTGKSHIPAVRGAPKETSGKILIDQSGVLRSGDKFQVSFKASQNSYVYVILHDSKGEISQLFPNPKVELSTKVIKDNVYVIPAKNKWFWLDENVGKETIYLLATKNPLVDTQTVMNTLKTEGIGKLQKKLGANLLATKVITIFHTDDKLSESIGKTEQKVKTVQPENKLESKNGQQLFNNSKDTIQAFVQIKEHPIGEDIINALDNVERSQISKATRGAGGGLIYKKASPAVTVVLTISGKKEIEGEGSGAILDEVGHVITNWHVVKDRAEVIVILKPLKGVEIKEDLAFVADVIRTDAVADLALLKIKNPPKGLPILKLGSINKVEVGQEVYAIGHPEGEVWTYTKGIISQIRPNYEWVYEDGSRHKAKVIQTQTPINPGSSGSPLLNEGAEIIGINSFTKRGEGLNYAISSDEIQNFLNSKGNKVSSKRPLWGDLKIKYYIEYDRNKDGIVDLVAVDIDGDKKPDMWIFDDNQDNRPDYVGFDTNGNGKVDCIARDLDGDGFPETYEFDTNGDGKIDLYGIDDDKDYKIDRYVGG
jgi:S1-C subfamily serine protease